MWDWMDKIIGAATVRTRSEGSAAAAISENDLAHGTVEGNENLSIKEVISYGKWHVWT